MNYQSKKCFVCKKDLISDLMMFQNSQCSCIFHQDCLTKQIEQKKLENLNKCPQCDLPLPPKIKTIKVHYQLELINNNNQKQELSVDQIVKEFEQQTQFIQDKTVNIEQKIYLLSEDTKNQNKEIQYFQSEQEKINKKIATYQSLENCPQKYRSLKDKLNQMAEEFKMLNEEKKFYENLYQQYYNDNEIDYENEISQYNIDADKRDEIRENMKKIQELRATLKNQNVENIGRQIIRTNFKFPPLNEEQSFINQEQN